MQRPSRKTTSFSGRCNNIFDALRRYSYALGVCGTIVVCSTVRRLSYATDVNCD